MAETEAESAASRTLPVVCVVGAGTMGAGIAQVAALAGCQTRLVDVSAEAAARGFGRIREQLDEGVARGKIPAAVRDAALARIRLEAALGGAVGDADLVVEAVPERFELKAKVFAELDALARSDALLASNTSSLSITALQRGVARPERIVGLHFFNPVHVMRLVEVVRGEQSAGAAVERAVEAARLFGKEPIVVKDSPGFASSRLGVALGLEAMRMVEEGVASPQDIDTAMELGYRHPMGPLRLSDLIGLDVRLAIAEHLHEALGDERFRPPALLRRMVAEGRLGKKSGQGFYRWEE